MIIVGEVGCGKTSCVKISTGTLQDQNVKLCLEPVFIDALDLENVFGYYDSQNQ